MMHVTVHLDFVRTAICRSRPEPIWTVFAAYEIIFAMSVLRIWHCTLQQPCATVKTALEGRRTRRSLQPQWCVSVSACFVEPASMLWILHSMAFLKASLNFMFHGMLYCVSSFFWYDCTVILIWIGTHVLYYTMSGKKALPSVHWHCWLGGRKGIRPVEEWGGMVEDGLCACLCCWSRSQGW